MKRSYLARTIISLPRLNAFQAAALAQALSAATLDADGKPLTLPSIVQSAHDEMKEDLETLLQALGTLSEDSPEAQEVDDQIDRIVSAFIRLHRVWAELEQDLPEAQAAARVLAHIDDDEGLSFVRRRKAEEWTIIEAKLQTIARENLIQDIGTIGATPIYQLLLTTHARYGEVTGMTKPLRPSEAPAIGEKFEELKDSIRQYAMAVAGSIERKKPETQVLADQLLKPLAEWPKSKSASKKAVPGAPATPEGGTNP